MASEAFSSALVARPSVFRDSPFLASPFGLNAVSDKIWMVSSGFDFAADLSALMSWGAAFHRRFKPWSQVFSLVGSKSALMGRGVKCFEMLYSLSFEAEKKAHPAWTMGAEAVKRFSDGLTWLSWCEEAKWISLGRLSPVIYGMSSAVYLGSLLMNVVEDLVEVVKECKNQAVDKGKQLKRLLLHLVQLVCDIALAVFELFAALVVPVVYVPISSLLSMASFSLSLAQM